MRIRRKQVVIDIVLLICGYMLGRRLFQQSSTRFDSESCRQRERKPGPIDTAVREHLEVSDHSLMIGVMTTRKNLTARASVVHSTWGRHVPGLIIFYIGRDVHPASTSDGDSSEPQVTGQTKRQDEDGYNRRRVRIFPKASSYPEEAARAEPIQWIHGLPVVQLEDVNDEQYPPMDKAFAMLRHMLDNFGSEFDWFMRADDDVYVRYDKLVEHLHTMDNSRPWYIGRPGMGAPKDKGLLGLTKPYCLGGPGVVFSRPALRLLVPRLGECALNAVSAIDDTELGRCMAQHFDIACTAGTEKETVFYNNYGKNTFTGKLSSDISEALTLHKVKESRDMFRLHVHFQQQRLQDLQLREKHLETQMKKAEGVVTGDPMASNTENSQAAVFNVKTTFNRQKSVTDFVSKTLSFDKLATVSLKKIRNPSDDRLKKTGAPPEKTYENGAEAELKDSQQRKSAVVDVLSEDNPVWTYAIFEKPGTVKLSNIHVSREQIMKKAADNVLASIKANTLNTVAAKNKIIAKYQTFTLPHGLQHMITASHSEGYQSFLLSSKFEPLQWREVYDRVSSDISVKNNVTQSPLNDRLIQKTKEFNEGTEQSVSYWPALHIMLALYGRHQTYLRFLNSLALAAESYPASVHLRVALYADDLQERTSAMEASHGFSALFNTTVIPMQAPFSLARARNRLSEHLSSNAVLIGMDVDMILTSGFLFRVGLSVKRGLAYFPVVFSQFSPLTACYGRDNCRAEAFDFSPHSGLWRDFGFGMVALTAGDLRKAGGYNNDFKGWGGEDEDFVERCRSKGLKIFRALDPGLVHIFHNKSCDPGLPRTQFSGCLSSRLRMMGSEARLAQIMLDIEG